MALSQVGAQVLAGARLVRVRVRVRLRVRRPVRAVRSERRLQLLRRWLRQCPGGSEPVLLGVLSKRHRAVGGDTAPRRHRRVARPALHRHLIILLLSYLSSYGRLVRRRSSSVGGTHGAATGSAGWLPVLRVQHRTKSLRVRRGCTTAAAAAAAGSIHVETGVSAASRRTYGGNSPQPCPAMRQLRRPISRPSGQDRRLGAHFR